MEVVVVKQRKNPWWSHHVAGFQHVDSIQKKITEVKNFDRRKYPQDVQGLTLYVGVVPVLWRSVIYRIVPFKFHLSWVTLKNCLWQTIVRAVVMCAPPPRATVASHCVQPPHATILFHLSAPKSLFLRHVDVHIRFDTTPIYLYSFQLLAPLQRLIATLGSTQFHCRFRIRVLLNC